jgi:hypothetical protein
MLLQQLTQMKALKEGQMKNAIMDTVEDHCRNADIPDGASYEQAVAAIVKSIRNTDSMASECPVSELTGYVKDYFPKDEYVTEDEEMGAPPAPEASADTPVDGGPEVIGKAGDYVVSLEKESETVTLKKGDETITSMPLVIWSQLKRQ